MVEREESPVDGRTGYARDAEAASAPSAGEWGHWPIFLDLDAERVVVSGGGRAALAKLDLLLRSRARIEVYASRIDGGLEAAAARGRLTLHRRRLEREDLRGARLVYCASGAVEEDRRVRALARAEGVLVNVVDDPGASDFVSPAIVDRAPVLVAIGTGAAAPVLARRIKAEIEALLPAGLGPLAHLAGAIRPAVRRLAESGQRRAFWTWLFGPAGVALVRRLGVRGARRELVDHLLSGGEPTPPEPKVFLVGAGPGDPDLLTLRARRVLHDADVVLFDRLVEPGVLELARREALRIEVGKSPRGPACPQTEINDALIRHARAGRRVVRLKSGDPLVFGRGDEELDALVSAGIDYEIVPGVTAATAAAAAAGVSLTRRGRNASVAFVTARDAAGYAEHDWRTLAGRGMVTAVYMGAAAARFVQGRLLLHGADPATPVTVVRNAARRGEWCATGMLGDLVSLLEPGRRAGPAVILIGVAARRAARIAGAPAPVRAARSGGAAT